MASTVFLPDIDYDRRPMSYSDFDHPLRAILSGVPTQARRKLIRKWIEANPGQTLPEGLLANAPTSFDREMASQVHPSWYGGQFLPSVDDRTVEVARVVMASTLCDVVAVYATWSGGRWRYRAVDDFSGGLMTWELPQKSSVRPLSLSGIVSLLDGLMSDDLTGDDKRLIWGVLEFNWDGPSDTTTRRFFSIESEIYPQLQQHYRNNIDAWCDRKVVEWLINKGEL